MRKSMIPYTQRGREHTFGAVNRLTQRLHGEKAKVTMNIKVKVYNGEKYNKNSVKVAEVEYKNIKSVAVKTIEDKEIYNAGFDEVDPRKEYCIVTAENGEESTFRNSFVDMFLEY